MRNLQEVLNRFLAKDPDNPIEELTEAQRAFTRPHGVATRDMTEEGITAYIMYNAPALVHHLLFQYQTVMFTGSCQARKFSFFNGLTAIYAISANQTELSNTNRLPIILLKIILRHMALEVYPPTKPNTGEPDTRLDRRYASPYKQWGLHKHHGRTRMQRLFFARLYEADSEVKGRHICPSTLTLPSVDDDLVRTPPPPNSVEIPIPPKRIEGKDDPGDPSSGAFHQYNPPLEINP